MAGAVDRCMIAQSEFQKPKTVSDELSLAAKSERGYEMVIVRARRFCLKKYPTLSIELLC